jgi:TolB-like protein/Flp pilus assembly protein TadD
MHVYKFRNCLLNPAERSVINEGQHVNLTTKTFDVLEYLIQNAGKVVSKDEILGNVWNGNFVEESNLPVHISKLRKSLHEANDRRFIETVQGVGYRFVAPLQTVDENEWRAASDSGRGSSSDAGIAARNVHSIAVLPLQNESGDPNVEYLTDGLTESLINGLSQIPGLRVIARNTVFEYKTTHASLASVATNLGVSRVLTGRVRLIGENLMVGVELTNAVNGTQIWGNRYERPFSDVVAIQHEIVDLVSEILMENVFQGISRSPDIDAESYKAYLMGKHLLEKRTASATHKAIQYLYKSISYSPNNVFAYVAIVESYRYLYILDNISRAETLARIKPFVETLNELGQFFDVVQLMHAKLEVQLGWNLGAAERYVRNALQINPNSVDSHSLCADIMTFRGELDEVTRHAYQILALDPISLVAFKRVGRIFYRLEQYDKAVACLKDAYEMEPSDWETSLLLGAVYAELNVYDEALRFLQMSYDSQQNIESLSMIGYVKSLAGNKQGALRTMERIKSEFRNHSTQPENFARIYLVIGEKEVAYTLLEQAFREHAMEMWSLAIDPRLKTIRKEARFRTLVRRVEDSCQPLRRSKESDKNLFPSYLDELIA